jgi:hypothetical protein
MAYDPSDPDGSKAAEAKKEKEKAEIIAQMEALKTKLATM